MNKFLNPARNSDESFEEYKDRRRVSNHAVKVHLKGRMFWPRTQGTYRKP